MRASRRERARALVAEARALDPEATALRERATRLREEAEALLKDVKPWEPEEKKAAGWAKEDEAQELERQADLTELEARQLLTSALTQDPDLPEAHAALAERFRKEHAAAEATRDEDAASRAEVFLQLHSSRLPAEHEARERHAAYLQGDGALTLVTEPAGAEVLLHRYELKNRRLVLVPVRSLGCTPIRELSMPKGSYLLLLHAEGRAEVRYPGPFARFGRSPRVDAPRSPA